MLILTRKVGEAIAIGEDIEVHVIEAKGNQVKLGIRAPKHVEVHREEIFRRIQEENRRASQVSADALASVAELLTPDSK